MKYSKSPLHISDTQMHSTHSFSLKVEHNGQCKHNFVHKKMLLVPLTLIYREKKNIRRATINF